MKRPTSSSTTLLSYCISHPVLLSVVLGGAVFVLSCLSVAISVENGPSTATTESSSNDKEKQQQQRQAQQQQHDDVLQPWQSCSVFLAPTPTMNWGVYASRGFEKGEIIQIAPLTLPVPSESIQVENSVLWDYVYGYWRVRMPPLKRKTTTTTTTTSTTTNGDHHRPDIIKMYSVLLGMDMFLNHHPYDQNVEFTTFGREPDPDHGVPETAINVQGLVAKRRIKPGEELFSSYNGKEDGGTGWFGRRGIKMETPSVGSTAISTDDQLRHYQQEYCSKIYASVGLPSWRDRLMPLLPPGRSLPFWIDLKWLAPFDGGLGDAKAKVDIRRGERIELSTALVMSIHQLTGSPIRPLVFAWNDLQPDQQDALRTLRENKQLLVQYQDAETGWKSHDSFRSFEDLALFPVAGNIGLVRRLQPRTTPDNVQIETTSPAEDAYTIHIIDNNIHGGGSSSSNCRLVIHSDRNVDTTGVGVTIELVATQDIAYGDDLVLNVPATDASPKEYRMLVKEMKLTGQPYSHPYLSQVMMTTYKNWQQGKRRSAGEEL